MTATTSPPVAPAEAPATSSAPLTARGRLRGWLGPIAFLSALVIVAVLVSLGTRWTPTGDLDPEGADPAGSRAAVQIARDLGTDVTIARDTAAAAGAVDGDTLLVLVHSHRLTGEEIQRLADLPGDRLLVLPTTQTLRAFVPEASVSGRAEETEEEVLEAGCGLAAAEAAGSATMGGELYSVEGAATGCYPAEGGDALVRVAGDSGTTTVLGTGDPLRNAHLDQEGNAALSLNLLTERPRVVWLIPDVAPAGDSEGGLLGFWLLLPIDVHAAELQLLVALLLLALWRARRLGPLATEHLPVVVRAAETAQGRARLYRSRRARDRAAAALRSGFLGRTRPLLGLARDAGPDAVASAVAARAGRDPATVRALLYGAGPAPGGNGDSGRDGDGDTAITDDAALVRLADELDTLEREVRRS